ncbi:uncharacterized protein LOC105845019 isoform X1 [Hydra vulgaris]|uniref:uncharacterized protein LOC105845019 isoform X1 n=1 Tax=Hydra vulgaris TaxID=6087 RepID=UPI0032EA5223
MKFSIENGNPGVLFQSLTDNTKYLCHSNWVPIIYHLASYECIYYIFQKNDSYVMIRSKSYSSRYLWQNDLLFAFQANIIGKTANLYKFVVCDFSIKKIDPISKYSVNVFINESSPIFNTPGLRFMIKCESSNNEITKFNVTGNSVLITLSHSNTTYKFSAGFQNEYGIYVFGNVSYYKTDEDEYYGRGILVNADKSYLYICMNQHVESIKPACYYSNITGDFIIDLDVSVGCVLGHHLITKELYAIHRNQKLYLYFNTVYNKWLGLTNEQFDKISLNLENQMMKNFDMDEDQYYTLGVNQWRGNAAGLFYRNDSSSLWTQRVKWNHNIF